MDVLNTSSPRIDNVKIRDTSFYHLLYSKNIVILLCIFAYEAL